MIHTAFNPNISRQRGREREFSMATHRTSQTFAPPKEDIHVEPVEGLKLSNLNHNFFPVRG
ncbi:hypothetical protein QQF64_009820, partial [Cirrhinus molitorella]